MSESQAPEVSKGQASIAAVAVLSALAAGVLLVYILAKIIRNRRHPTLPKLDNAMPYFFVNLLVLDIVMAIGSVMNIRWAVEKKLYAGTYCTAQAVIKQIGNNGVAWQTTAIAVYSVAWYNQWNDRHPHVTGPLVLLCIWVSLVVITAVPPSVDSGFYGPAGKWCFVPGNRDGARIAVSYMWYWLCAIVTIVAYVGIYLDAAGRLAGAFGKKGIWIGLKRSSGRGLGCGVFGLPMETAAGPAPPHPEAQDSEAGSARTNDRQINGTNNEQAATPEHVQKAKQLCCYAFWYTVIIIPQTVVRLVELNGGKEVPLWATVLCATIFNTSGLINAILYWMGLRQFGIPEPIVQSQAQPGVPSPSSSTSGDREK